MVEVGSFDTVDGVLSMATDLCLALGAFAVRSTGEVHVAWPDTAALEGGSDRIAALGRSSLEHPAARARNMFWNAEVATEGESADRSLACVVVPVWAGSEQLGLLGVVDTWLPEPDDDQSMCLEHLASTLARMLYPGAASETVPAPPGGAHGVPSLHADPHTHEHEPADSRTHEHEPAPADAHEHPDAHAHADAHEPAPADEHAHEPARAYTPVQVDASALVAALDDGVVCLDADGTVVLSNHAADTFYGLPMSATLAGAPLPALGGLRTEEGDDLAPEDEPAARTARDGAPCDVTVVVGEQAASPRRVTISARPIRLAGRQGVLVVLHDSTHEWLERQRLTRFALFDPLTGLANRYLLLEELGRMLQGLGRSTGSVALVFMDLDHFKHINDEYGHDMGDEVLGAVARRLRGAVRADDVVARLGGDEFVIAHASGEPLPDGDVVVSRLRKVLAAPFRVRGQVFDVGASIGWVSTERGDMGPEVLLSRADHAMYRHKRDRGSRGLGG